MGDESIEDLRIKVAQLLAENERLRGKEIRELPFSPVHLRH
jgi:hypothetical protein